MFNMRMHNMCINSCTPKYLISVLSAGNREIKITDFHTGVN